jgi:hypothetical protein
MLIRFFAALVLSLPQSTAPAVQGDDAAWLVPADATVVVRLESAQAWNELVRAFAPLAGEAAAQHDLQAVLDALASPPSLGGEAATPRLDPARPLYLAVTLDPSAGQFVTLVAPVTNGQQFRFQPMLGPTANLVRGGYTAVSNRPGYAANAAPNALLAELRAGVLSAHVDLATLIAVYRPLIDMGLAQLEATVDRAPVDDEMSFDVQPLMEVYLGAARALVNGADSLDLALERRGDELGLRFDYREREERAGGAAIADVTPLLGYVDPASSIQMALTGKVTDYLDLFAGLTEPVIAIYPEPLRTDVRRLLELQDELDPLLLPGLVVGFDLGAPGMRGSYVLRSPRPLELRSKIEELLRGLDHEGGLLRVGTAEDLSVGGVEARVLPLEIQPEAMLDALTAMSAPPGAPGDTPDDTEQELRAAMEALYGRDLRLGIAPMGELVALVLAGDDAEMRAELARLEAPAAASPELAGLLANVESGALGLAYQLDFGRWMGQMLGALQGVLPGPGVALPEREASIGFWGSAGGRTWSGGMVMNLAELTGFVRAVQGLESR